MVCVPQVGPFTHYSHYHPTACWEDCTEEFASETPNCERSTSASPLVITTRLRDLRMRGRSRQRPEPAGMHKIRDRWWDFGDCYRLSSEALKHSAAHSAFLSSVWKPWCWFGFFGSLFCTTPFVSRNAALRRAERREQKTWIINLAREGGKEL